VYEHLPGIVPTRCQISATAQYFFRASCSRQQSALRVSPLRSAVFMSLLEGAADNTQAKIKPSDLEASSSLNA
jgi:hypothetical protein